MDTYEVTLNNGDVYEVEADHQPSEQEISSAVDFHESSPTPFSGMLSRVGFPLAAALAGEGALSLVAPEAGLPLMAATSGLAAAGGAATRELLSERQLNPREIAETGVGYAAFPGLFKAAAPIARGISPVVSRILPFLRSVGIPGTVLNTAVRGGLSSGVIGGGVTAAEEGTQGRVPDVGDILRAAKSSALYGGATAGAFQAFGPPKLGGGNFWEALGGHKARIQALERGSLQEVAQADYMRTSEQTRLQSEAEQQLSKIIAQEQVAQQGLITQSRKVALQLRRDLPESLHQLGREKWQPVEALAEGITDQINPNELFQSLEKNIQNDPIRLEDAKVVLSKFLRSTKLTPPEGETPEVLPSARYVAFEELPPNLQQEALKRIGLQGGQAGLSSKTLINISSKLGQKLPASVKSRLVRSDAGDLPFHDARLAIADVLEQHAPENLKGAFAAGKRGWADFVNESSLAHKYFRPGSSTLPSTEPGAGLLRKIAEDLATIGKTPEDIGFIKRIGSRVGYNPLEPLFSYAKRLQGIPEAKTAITQRFQEGMKRSQGVFEGSRLQAEERIKPEIQALKAQAQQARRLAYLGGIYPVLYMLRRTISQGLRTR